MLKPDYLNCILNIVSSVKKYYKKEYTYPSNKLLDKELESNPKHIILMVLDGMGSYIIDKHSGNLSFLVNNKKDDISSVFPSTTSASIPACVSGKAPIETCWIGWQNYVKEIDKHVVFFKNTDYTNDEKLDFDIQNLFPYKPFYNELDVDCYEVGPYFYVNGCASFKEFVNRLIDIVNKDTPTFTYAYWDNPDKIMHGEGTNSKGVRKTMKDINKHLVRLNEKMKDTCLIITADHGHIDSNPIYIRQYYELYEMLMRMPSNEGRCTFFKVKENKHNDFKNLFNELFSEKFILMTKEEFLDNEFLGLKEYSITHNRIDEIIGDYVSIGIDKFYFDVLHDKTPNMVLKSHHAGLTKEELTVPLVICKH